MASSSNGSESKIEKNESLPRGLLGKGGTPISKSTRLPSIRGPKDLTLGGIQRKSFKPTIPIRPRDKPSIGNIEDKIEIKPKRQKKERDKAGKGCGSRGKTIADTIQSQSIFAQGPTAKTIRKDGCSASSAGGVSFKAKSSTSVKIEKQEKEVQHILDNLLRDDFMDDDVDEIDITSQPVGLPLLDSAKFDVKHEDDAFVKGMVTEDNSVNSCAELLTKDSELVKLVLVQLPDCLPGLMPQNEPPTKTNIKQEPNTSQEEKLSKELSQCSLADLTEGKIGKLQILASGKTRLLLGDITLDLARGAPCGFLQELVSVQVEGDSGEITALGRVSEKLVSVPNIDCLLDT